MCNPTVGWYRSGKARLLGLEEEPDAWLGKVVPEGKEFRWSYGILLGTTVTGRVAEESRACQIVDTFQQALDLAEGFDVVPTR